MSEELIFSAVILGGAGVFSGFLAGLFGIGGGAVLVPILVAVLTFQGVHDAYVVHLAVGTSLAVIIPTAIRSFLAHRGLGAGNGELLHSWVILVPLGVIVASLLVGFVPGKLLKLVFAGVATLIALKMLLNRQSWVIGDTLPSKIVIRTVGFTIGFLSTFMGIGGGNLNNLFMTAYGQTMQQAVATSAGLGVLIAIPGAIGYLVAGWGLPGLPAYAFGYIYMLAVIMIVPFSILAAPVGVRLAHWLPSRYLEIVFGLFLLCVVAAFIVG